MNSFGSIICRLENFNLVLFMSEAGHALTLSQSLIRTLSSGSAVASVDIRGFKLDLSDVRKSAAGDSETLQLSPLITRWISLLQRHELIQLYL